MAIVTNGDSGAAGTRERLLRRGERHPGGNGGVRPAATWRDAPGDGAARPPVEREPRHDRHHLPRAIRTGSSKRSPPPARAGRATATGLHRTYAADSRRRRTRRATATSATSSAGTTLSSRRPRSGRRISTSLLALTNPSDIYTHAGFDGHTDHAKVCELADRGDRSQGTQRSRPLNADPPGRTRCLPGACRRRSGRTRPCRTTIPSRGSRRLRRSPLRRLRSATPSAHRLELGPRGRARRARRRSDRDAGARRRRATSSGR